MQNHPPVCCTLTSEGLRERRAQVLAPFLASVRSIERLPDGVSLELGQDEDTLRATIDLIVVERQCCQFLKFELTAEPGLGTIRLRLSGPPGTAEFLDSELGIGE
jgi:hypothetical protein